MDSSKRPETADGRTTALACAVVAAFAVAALLRVPWLNGPWYWTWPWRDLSPLRTLLCFAPAAALLAFSLRRVGPDSEPVEILPLLCGTSLLMQAGSALAEALGLAFVPAVVASPGATSYYTDALRIRELGPWLDRYDQTDRALHSSTHPPGPIFYYYVFLRVLGPDGAAVAGGWGVGLLASLAPLLVYRFAGLWSADRLPRLWAAAIAATLPGTAYFFPEFDQVYPLFSMGLLLLWSRALEGSSKAAVGAGALLFAATFFAYNLLVLGAFMALLAWKSAAWKRFALASALLLGTAGLLYGLLHLASGFDPWASFRQALSNQAAHAAVTKRPYGPSLFFDLYDFLLIGAGPLVAVLLAAGRAGAADPASRTLTRLALASVLIVDLTGLLRTETARVWLFLQPLLVVPAGLELARLPAARARALLFVQLAATAIVESRMTFIRP